MQETVLNDDRLVAAVSLVGRTGASDFEIGYLRDDVPIHEAEWWAKANYQGTRVYVQNRAGPVQAAEALARKVANGGLCTGCAKIIKVGRGPASKCVWTRVGDDYLRGCDGKGSGL